MNKISCIVIDDEPLAVQLMETYVKKTPFLDLKGSFTNGKTAYAFLQSNMVDLVISDIQMPDLNGIELSKMLDEDTRVIFSTAFSNYAVEGFKVNALDYMLKPVSFSDFTASAEKAREFFEMREAANASNVQAAQEDAKSIFVKADYKLQQIMLDNIICIEGLKDYVKIRQDNGSDPILTLMRLKTMEDILPKKRFVRVHRSYIVQIAKINAIERNHIIIGKERIPIGDTYQDALFAALSGTALFPAQN